MNGSSAITVSRVTRSNLREWQTFVDGSPDAGPLHQAGWYDVLTSATAVKPVFLLARDESGDICGILPCYISKSVFTGSHVSSLEGGALAKNAEALYALETAARDMLNEPGVGYVQIRGGPIVAEPAATLRTVHTVIETAKGSDALWNVVQAKTRWGVRKAQQQELVVESDPSLAELDAFYDLYAIHMRELGTPVFSRQFFLAMRSYLGPERLRLYLIRYQGTLIGGMLCVVHGAGWTDLYAIVRRSAETEYANYLLYWHVIEDAAKHEVRRFDLGRSAPGSNVHQFKQKWRGTDVDVSYSFYTAVGRDSEQLGLLREAREKGLRERVWSQLPLTFCNFVGPLIRRQLPFL